jgi:hypothetical protein
MQPAAGQIATAESFTRVLETYGVTHVLSPIELTAARFSQAWESVFVYPLNGRRTRIVRSAQRVSSNLEAARLLTTKGFDPDETVFLHDAQGSEASPAGSTAAPGEARIVAETSRSLKLQVAAPAGGFLLVADTYYPGWQAAIDGRPASIIRANISSRAVALPAGNHTVEFTYQAAHFFRGLKVTGLALVMLLLWIGTASLFLRRTRPENSAIRASGSKSSRAQPTATGS